jgi:Fe-S-cluster containining protein
MSSESDLEDEERGYDIRDAGDLAPFDPPECLDCGACCHADYVHVWVSGSDHARLTPEERDRLTFFEGTMCYMRMTDGHCAALVLEDAQWKCSVYERRPFLCREFARGGSACRHESETKGVHTRAALTEARRLLPRAEPS